MSGVARKLLALGDALLASTFHPLCLHCGKFCGADRLCEGCRGWEFAKAGGCDQCGAETPTPILRCGLCVKHARPWVRARSLLRLNEPMRSVIHQIKYGSWRELLDMFDEPIRDYFALFLPTPFEIVPVPLHRARASERGFNQAEDLARKLGKLTGMPVTTRLIKEKATEPQSTLSERERRKNLKGAFVWLGEGPERVLVVDDVFTTGNTMTEVARTLLRSGVKETYIWTLFRA